jgi:membrane protein
MEQRVASAPGGKGLMAAYLLLRETFREYSADRAVRMGASLAYYALFAFIPVVLLAISVSGFIVGQEVIEGEVFGALEERFGPEVMDTIYLAIEQSFSTKYRGTLPIVAFGALLFSATVLLAAWKETIDMIWDVPWKRGIKATVRRRLFGVAVIFGSGLLLALTMIAEFIVGLLERFAPGALLDGVLTAVGSIMPAVLGFVALALLYRTTPEVEVGWRHVWLGTGVTAVLLAIGSWAFGFYWRTVGSASFAGAATGVMVALFVFYGANQILLFGAELIKVSARNEIETAQSSVSDGLEETAPDG